MTNPKLTNILLSLIAVLLLVLVIQNGSSRSPHATSGFPTEMAHQAPSNSRRGSSMPMHGMSGSQSEQEAHSVSMVIGSLNCPSDASLTLTEAGCRGKNAEERRALVKNAMAQGTSISSLFDLVVTKFGEAALTESALHIWKRRQEAIK